MTRSLKIAVVGSGAAGYFAAAAIKRNCANADVTVIYDPATPHVGVGESVAWNGPWFMYKYLGLGNDFAWLRKSRSSFKYSVALQGFHGTDELYHTTAPFNPSYKVLYKSIWDDAVPYMKLQDGPSIYDVLLHLRAKDLIDGSNIQQYAAEKFWYCQNNTSPVDTKGKWSTSQQIGHSYHINANYIKDVIHELVGVPAGVKTLGIKIKDVVLGSNGDIDSLLLDNGEKFSADLFIDCSGFARILAKRLPYVFDHCDEYFNDTALVGPHHFTDPSEYTGYTLSAAMDYGWRFSISADNRSGEGYQFNSRIFNNEDQLIDEYYRKTGKTDVNFRKLKWTPGYYRETFVNNCITMGISHGFSDVFDANNFSSTLRHIGKLVDYIQQDSELTFHWRKDFNKYAYDLSWDIVFRIQTAFHLARRNDTVYWQEMKQAAKKFDTEQRLIDACFDPRRKTAPGIGNNTLAYSSHMFMNQAIYNQTPIPKERCLLNIDHNTEQQALAFFNFFKTSYELKSKTAPSIASFYKNIYPTAYYDDQQQYPNYHDFMG